MHKEAAILYKISSLPYFLWVVFVTAFVAAFLPVMSGLISTWTTDDNSHGFLVVPIALYIIWGKRKEIAASVNEGSRIGLAVAAISLVIYIFSKAGEIATLASLSMIGFICGSVIFLFGCHTFNLCTFPIFLLLFMIPIPSQIVASVTIPLQLLVTKAAVLLASIAGIPVYREGNVIFHAKGTFEVVQACSGLRSITALLMLGALTGYFTLRSISLRLILFASAIPIAILVNIIRVFVLVAVLQYLGINLSHGTPHTILGITIFGLAIGLFLLVAKGLSICER
jgi:exosortase A